MGDLLHNVFFKYYLFSSVSQVIDITYLIAREVFHRKSIVEVVQMLLIVSDHRHNNDHILKYFWHQLVKWAMLEHV